MTQADSAALVWGAPDLSTGRRLNLTTRPDEGLIPERYFFLTCIDTGDPDAVEESDVLLGDISGIWESGPLQQRPPEQCHGLHHGSAVSLVFPGDDRGFDILPFFWMPEEAVRERQRRDGMPYQRWVEQGFVEVSAGNVIDYHDIMARLE